MNTTKLSQLSSFTGTEQYHRTHPTTLLSDGALFLANNADCFWLMDIVNSYQPNCKRDEMLQSMQFWTLRKGPAPVAVVEKVHENGGIVTIIKDAAAHVVCERDSDDPFIVQDIEYTDFPFTALNEVRLYCGPADERNVVIYLPSEY